MYVESQKQVNTFSFTYLAFRRLIVAQHYLVPSHHCYSIQNTLLTVNVTSRNTLGIGIAFPLHDLILLLLVPYTAVVDLNGRYFGGRTVKASFFSEDRFAMYDLAPEPSQ